MNPKISVIIPVYKVEPYLRQCLDSVVNQTYHNLEIIIIDDGSPDNCGKICDEYAAKDERITMIHKENGGLCAARNDGINRATGEWITFVDSDDWCDLDYYEKLLFEMGNADVDVFCAGGRILESVSKSTIEYFPTDLIDLAEEEMPTMLLAPVKKHAMEIRGTPWDKLYRTRFIQDNNLFFDLSLKSLEDLWFNFCVLSKTKKVSGCSYIGYHYRNVSDSITKGYNPNKPKELYAWIEKLHLYLETYEQSNSLQTASEALTIVMIAITLHCYYFHPSNSKSLGEVLCEIKDMKTWPYFQEAIKSNNKQYLTKNQILFKYLLRLPCEWPVKIAYELKYHIRKWDS